MPRKNKNSRGTSFRQDLLKDELCKECKRLERKIKYESTKMEKGKKEGNRI